MQHLSSQAHANLQAAQHFIEANEPDRAEFDLQEWCDNAPEQEPAPPAARVLLAALLARRGELLRARVVLGEPQRRDQHDMNASEGQLAASLLIAAGLESDGRRLAAWLHHLHGHDSAVSQWVKLLDLPGLGALPQVERNHRDQLAAELTPQPEIVPSLVYAQHQAPNLRTISLLRSALGQIVHSFESSEHYAPLLQALAELAEMATDHDDALRWAHRGLSVDPFNATLALLLGRIDDNEAVGPSAAQVLKRVSMKFPGYPDLQQALENRNLLDSNTTDENREAA